MGVSSLALAWLLAAQTLPSDVNWINARSFSIPININDPAQRAKIKNLLLYVSPDEGKTWTPTASASVEQTEFRFNAPTDGLYWLTVIVVDPNGVRAPVDPYHADPNQKIFVDSVPPVIKSFTAGERTTEEAVVSWDIQEDHPNLGSLRLEYRPQDAPEGTVGTPIPAPPGAQLKGEVHFHPNVPGPLLVRMKIMDLAKNEATHDLVVPAAPTPPLPPVPPPTTVSSTVPTPAPTGTTVPSGPVAPAPIPSTMASAVPQTFTPPAPHEPPPAPAGAQVIATAGGSSTDIVPVSGFQPAPPPPSATAMPRPQLVNSRDISLEYEVRTGASGLSKVELWVTKDDGRTWEFLTDNPNLHPPITATLPGEGVFGLRLVVCSGAGLSKGPPQSGDLPEVRIEVDLTPPHMDLYRPKPDPYQQRDALVITWNATDRNLPSRPVKLEFAEKPEGSWLPIAADLPAAGSYTWQLPKNVPYRVFLRACAVDLAGNHTVAETREPVLIDLTNPEVVALRMMSAIKKVSAEVPVPESTPRPPQPMPERVPADSTPKMVPPPVAPRPSTFEPAPVERTPRGTTTAPAETSDSAPSFPPAGNP